MSGQACCAYSPTSCTWSESPSDSASGSIGETSRPLTTSRTSGCRSRTTATVRNASSIRYDCVWSPPRIKTGPSGGRVGAGVKKSTSTAFGRISHDTVGSPRKRSLDCFENSLW